MNQKAKDIFKISLIYIFALVLGVAATFFFPNVNALYKVAVADLVATIVVFIFSMIYKNSSVYDPYWSVVPIFIVLYWMIDSGSLLILLDYLIRRRGQSPARLKAFTLAVEGQGQDLHQEGRLTLRDFAAEGAPDL